jgi:exosortase/archaeosortase family protein
VQSLLRPREKLAAHSVAAPPGRHAAPRVPGPRNGRNTEPAGPGHPVAAVGAPAPAAISADLPSAAGRRPWPADGPAGFPADRRVPGGHRASGGHAGRGNPGGSSLAELAPYRQGQPRVPDSRASARRRFRGARGPLAPARPTSTRKRIAAISVLAVIALTLIIFQFTFRVAEAALAATFFRFFTPVLAASRAPNIWFGLGTVHAFGLEITPDCSSSLLLVPLCGLGMLLMIPRRLNVSLVIRALIVAATMLVVVNTLRIGVIALCVHFWGLGVGYQVGHLLLGSLVSIIGIGLSMVLLTAIVASRRGLAFSAALLPRHRRRRS